MGPPPGASNADGAVAAAMVGQVTAPGDVVMRLPQGGRVAIGAGGLRPVGEQVVATKCGVVRLSKGSVLWVEGRQKRYIPAEGDTVIGTVVDRHSEHLIVNIGGPFRAVLPLLSFENATKRNRPAIYEGDLVAARVAEANPDMDPVLTCVDAQGKGAGLGHLKGGLVAEVSCAWARALLSRPMPAALAALGREAAFELAVGLNGRLWVDTPGPALTARVARALQRAEEELGPGDDAAAFARRALAVGGGGGGG